MKDSHAFNVGIACTVGVNCALILNHLSVIHKLIFLKEENWSDGKLWIRKTVKDMANIYPYMTEKEIRGAMDRLERDGFIVSTKSVSGQTFDRGKCYSFTVSGLQLMEVEKHFYHSENPFDKRANGYVQKGKSHLYKRANEYKEDYKDYTNSLYAQGNENTHVEAQPNLNQPAGRGPGSTVTVRDPELPGVVIVESGPVTPPPAKLGLYDRPKAETPVQLESKLREFYTDWPEEWKTGILENGKGRAHSDERRREIVKDFCCWAIDNNRGGDTFQMLNARLQQWFRNEQYSTWKQKSKPAEAGTPSYSIPKNAVY